MTPEREVEIKQVVELINLQLENHPFQDYVSISDLKGLYQPWMFPHLEKIYTGENRWGVLLMGRYGELVLMTHGCAKKRGFLP